MKSYSLENPKSRNTVHYQPQLELLIRTRYRASVDYSIKVSIAILSTTQSYYIEGSNCHGDPGIKPTGLALGRCSNKIFSEEQAEEDMQNELGQW